MTPAARLSTAIEILDLVLEGQPAGMTLTNWGRQNRYAGSRDRAAIRDIVFDCLRARRSLAHLGGAQTGRAMIVAYASREGMELDEIFSGEGYNPERITDEENAALVANTSMKDAVRLNYPDFLDEELKRSLGDNFEAVMKHRPFWRQRILVQSLCPELIRHFALRKTTDAWDNPRPTGMA